MKPTPPTTESPLGAVPSGPVATPSSLQTRAEPRPLPARPRITMREPLRYRVKRRLLGPPLPTDQLEHERLGNPTALAVFASDNLSSSAYATEEILRVLVPAVGVAAFSLVVPITVAMLVVLGFLILSYRETIKEYPTAGGAYMVTRDNFGLLPAQVAGVALLTDYILTVAVSVAAGTAALASAVHVLGPWRVPISVCFVVIIAFANLRGVRESGALFRIPTFFFIAMMIVLLTVGFFRLWFGDLPRAVNDAEGLMPFGQTGSGLLLGASLYKVLHAFASGGAAVTGVEAISNGVPAFKKPEWKNARQTLVVMGSLLGAMFLGLSVLASHLHVAPFEAGVPTVISEIARLVFGDHGVGQVFYFLLQAGTMLILVLAANTSFADFPRLASFHAGDNFMPKQLTKRGHRLVFSNGIVALAATAIVLIVITQARVEKLIPLYAIGVFLSFTMSQAGMARHHVRLKHTGWRRGLFVNGVGCLLSAVVCIVIAATKFLEGAWFIVLLVPIMVYALVRLNRQYVSEAAALEHNVTAAATERVLPHHVVLVFVDQIDLAAAAAIRYARTLVPDEMRAVHVAVDPLHAAELAAHWQTLGLTRFPLELVDCPDRRLVRHAAEVVGDEAADGRSEVTVLLPRRVYRRFWHRFLHDRTAEELAAELGRLPNTNVTFVPVDLGGQARAATAGEGSGG